VGSSRQLPRAEEETGRVATLLDGGLGWFACGERRGEGKTAGLGPRGLVGWAGSCAGREGEKGKQLGSGRVGRWAGGH
jgi:hypothetical protein